MCAGSVFYDVDTDEDVLDMVNDIRKVNEGSTTR